MLIIFITTALPICSSTPSAIILLWFSNLFLVLYKQFPSFVNSLTLMLFTDFLYAPY